MAKNKNATYVILTWHDSCSDNASWIENDDVTVEPLLIASAGLLIKETKEILCIACATYEERSASIFQIPKSCIQKIKRIKFPFNFTR